MTRHYRQARRMKKFQKDLRIG